MSIEIVDDGGDLTVPAQCVAWCREQDYGVSVCDDMAPVDLDWWKNTRVERHSIPTRIVGRDADGAPTDHGVGYLRRADLTGDCDGGQNADTSAEPGSADLAVLYRAGAWLSEHPDRDRRRYFPNVRTPASSGGELNAVTAALAARRHTPWQVIPDAACRAAVVGLGTHPWCRPCRGLGGGTGRDVVGEAVAGAHRNTTLSTHPVASMKSIRWGSR